MVESSYNLRSQEAFIEYLVKLKTEVLNFLNGQPSLSYPEFYTMYSEARTYFSKVEMKDLEARQAVERWPELSKPSIFHFNVRGMFAGRTSGTVNSFVGTSLMFITAPISLPYLIINYQQEKKIRFQLNRLYTKLEKILWHMVMAS